MEMQKLYLLVPLAPLVGAMIAGLFCRVIPRWVAHTATIAGVADAKGEAQIRVSVERVISAPVTVTVR